MKKYDLEQDGRILKQGTLRELSKYTGLSEGTLINYSYPGNRNKNNGVKLHGVDEEIISKTEQDIQNEIRMALSYHAIVFRVNTGTVKTEDGRYFRTGVPKGYSDLSGFRKSDGKAFFLEIKTEKGRASKEQLHFLEQMSNYPVITGIVRSVDDALKLIEVEGAN